MGGNMKTCFDCGEPKEDVEFIHGSRLLKRCKQCRGKQLPQKSAPATIYQRHGDLRRKYGLTPQKYACILAAQGGVCAICGEAETSTIYGKVTPLSVDHDHATKTVRGLLCRRCNRMIGMAKDRIELLFAAMGYLQTHKLKKRSPQKQVTLMSPASEPPPTTHQYGKTELDATGQRGYNGRRYS